MESRFSNIALLVGGITIAGAALWYFGRENSGYDPEIHTLEKLRAVIKDLDREYQCIYCRNYNLLLKTMENSDKVGQERE